MAVAPRVLIVNADDFGLSESVNLAVIEAFERGLASSTTVMANMPGFGHACAAAVDRGFWESVGVHLVLTDGEPLTDAIRRFPRLCDAEGRFQPRRSQGRILRLSSAECAAVAAELRAQVEACRASGVPVTHLDSHQHVHTEPAVGRIVVRLARDLDIRFVRLTRNCRPHVPLSTHAHRIAFNTAIRRAGLAATRYFGDVDDYSELRASGSPIGAAKVELMIHPDLDERGRLVDFHCSRPGEELERLLDPVPGFAEAVSFAGVRAAGR